MTKAQKTARKAARTTAARRAFRRAYPNTASIAERLLRGESTYDVDRSTPWAIAGTSAAVLANLHRSGTFQKMALACRF